jgi:rhodanese-related sulfurtransferase
MQHITAPELAAWIADTTRAKPVLLDVREPWEFQTCHIELAIPVPMKTIAEHISNLDENAKFVCICHHGGRSAQVAAFLEQNGFAHVFNLTGGIHAWSLKVDASVPTY